MSDGRQAAFFLVLAPAAACWLAGLLWLGPHVLLTVPSVLLLGYAFWLDAAETLRRGRDAIIRYERAPVLRHVSKVDVRLAFLAQALTEAALIGWMVPLLLGPHLWFWLIPGTAIFMSVGHILGWRANAGTYRRYAAPPAKGSSDHLKSGLEPGKRETQVRHTRRSAQGQPRTPAAAEGRAARP